LDIFNLIQSFCGFENSFIINGKIMSEIPVREFMNENSVVKFCPLKELRRIKKGLDDCGLNTIIRWVQET